MTQDRKYFGMTIRQLGILIGLGVAVCLLFSVTGVFALRRGLGLLSPAPTSTSPAHLTATPFVLPTLIPTATMTPIPYEALLPEGWEQHQTTLVELWLPTGFKKTGLNAGSIVLANSAVMELSLAGTSPTSAEDTVFASVAYEPLITGSLDALLDDRLLNLPKEVRLAERHKALVNSMEVHRLIFEWQNGNVFTDDLLFIFLDGGTIWYVKYSADIKDFFEMLPIFDDSIQTFRIVR